MCDRSPNDSLIQVSACWLQTSALLHTCLKSVLLVSESQVSQRLSQTETTFVSTPRLRLFLCQFVLNLPTRSKQQRPSVVANNSSL